MTIDKRKLRDAFGGFATGVCIVTVAPAYGVPIGMTINSFSSVSLEPPLVLWSIQYTSECFDIFNAADKFAINVLSAEQETHSNFYSKKGQHALFTEHYRPGRTGSPVFRDALANFECRVWARYAGGDHLIIVGEVLEVTTRPSGRPLLFYKGKYGHIH
jgi:flavin reductase (DIM6/NTAB) family NADH-FMN oxidoreductase RutF